MFVKDIDKIFERRKFQFVGFHWVQVMMRINIAGEITDQTSEVDVVSYLSKQYLLYSILYISFY